MIKTKTLILGAGPAGLACAMELYRSSHTFTVVEKDKQVGGLAKTYRFGKFRTDNGPHRFFSQNKFLYGFIEDLLKEKWIKVNRLTRFYVNGKFYLYPVDWKNVFHNLGVAGTTKILVDFVLGKLKFINKKPRNFEDYALSTFGKSLAQLNVFNFNEKIWGLPVGQLSVDWATQRIKDLTLTSLIKNMVLKKQGPKTLVDQFYYPALGTGLIYEEIAKKLVRNPLNKILLSTEPVLLVHQNKVIKEAVLTNGKRIKFDNLVSSIPIKRLVSILSPKAPETVMQALVRLKLRSQVYLFLTINKEKISDDQWIYFPDRNIPFARVSEMRNFSGLMSPKGKTSLFIEFFCWEGDNIWIMDKKSLFDLTIAHLEKLGFVKRSEVIDYYLLRQKDSYPVYDLSYKKYLKIINDYLAKFSNLIYIGRPGRFKYTNQDHSLEMGIIAARSIIENKKYAIDKVGAESKYFERGYLK